MPRIAEKERILFAQKVRSYLERHRAGAADAEGLSYEAIAKGARVSRGHFARADTDPIIAELVREIQAARSSRAGSISTDMRTAAPAATAEPGATQSVAPTSTIVDLTTALGQEQGLGILSNDDLEGRILHYRNEAMRVTREWLGKARSASAPEDAPLLLHDLEKLMLMLMRQRDALRPLVTEQLRRLDGDVPDAVPAAPGATAGQVEFVL
jgi:hypothetical protein